MDKFLIIDGNSLAFRAFFALPNLTSKNGEPTGAIYGFVNMFTKVIAELQPKFVAVAFDFSRKTFRNEIFAEYKGTRNETPPDLKTQFPMLKQLLSLMKVKVLEMKNIEADDLIGTLSKKYDCEKVILSGDRDVLQLIDPTCEVWLTKKGITEILKVNEKVLKQEFSVSPEEVIDLKALMGDSSDNIPGVSGIGPKTATKLIEQFHTIENLYENIDVADISAKLKEKLIAEKNVAYMSKTLATIKTDVEIDNVLEDFEFKLPFSQEVTDYILNLDMSSLLKKENVFLQATPKETVKKVEVKKLNSVDELTKLCSTKHNTFSFDLSENLKFAFDNKECYIAESELTLFSVPIDLNECINVLKCEFENENITKILYNYKEVRHLLEKFNISIKGNVFDLSLANYLVKPYDVVKENVEEYASLYEILKKQLKKEDVEKLYNEIEFPLEDVLFDMENAGFKVDKQELISLSEKINGTLEEIVKDIYSLAGGEFNINSPKQLAEVLFVKLGLPCDNNKKLSTGVEILEDLESFHPIISEILRYRKLQKIKTTYLDVFQNIIAQTKDNIIHTIFNQTLTSTGRLSSSEPNLQNIPVRDEEGKEIRKIFVSRFENGMLVSADYNQIELRLLAHFSQDKNLIDGFNSGKDIHTLTASKIFNKPEQEITQNERRSAKAVNFGIVYGISSFGLARNIKVSNGEAQKYLNNFFELYPSIKTYMENNILFAERFGYVKTLFNRKRWIKELESQNFNQRQFGSRVARNMPLQGSASDIIKIAMIKVAEKIKKNNLKSVIALQIHDELVVDCPKNEIEQVKEILKTTMENVVKLDVLLPVEIDVGTSFYEI